jgi:hypothetical protein
MASTSSLPSPDTSRSGHRAAVVKRIAFVVAIAVALLFLFPVLAGPITGDDRYWYMWQASIADWSLLDQLAKTWSDLTVRLGYGRLNVLTGLERRLAARAVVGPALATSTPIVVYLALLKAALVAGGVLCAIALAKSLRWRAADGQLAKVGRRTLVLAGIAGTLALSVGAQAYSTEANGWNGWIAYPISTYGAVISIFGTVALLLWLTRLVAERSKGTAIIAVVVLVALGVATNFRYELVFATVPIAAVALAVVPVTDRTHRSAGRKAKLVTGLAYFGSFVPVFIAIRRQVASVCSEAECYDGAQVALGSAAVRTTLYNVLSAVPGTGGTELRANLEQVGWADRFPVLPTSWSVLAALLAIAALVAVWWTTGPVRRNEAGLLAIAAGISVLVAVGPAAIMGLSPHSHGLVTSPGILYRNAMVTSVGLAFALVFAVLAICALLRRSHAMLVWTALAVLIGIVGAITLPSNILALRANRIIYTASEAINWEVVLGDTGPGSDARRCELFVRAEGTMGRGTLDRLYRHADAAFERQYGQDFCSDPEFRDASSIGIRTDNQD